MVALFWVCFYLFFINYYALQLLLLSVKWQSLFLEIWRLKEKRESSLLTFWIKTKAESVLMSSEKTRQIETGLRSLDGSSEMLSRSWTSRLISISKANRSAWCYLVFNPLCTKTEPSEVIESPELPSCAKFSPSRGDDKDDFVVEDAVGEIFSYFAKKQRLGKGIGNSWRSCK